MTGVPLRQAVVYRPETAAFWVFVGALVVGVAGLATSFGSAFVETADAHLALAPLWVALMAFLIWLMLRFDAFRTVRRYPQMLLAGTALGGSTALAMSAKGNGALDEVWAAFLDADTLARWSAALTAPIIEEAAKLACAAVILVLCAPVCTRIGHALLVGMFVGFGFDVMEDLAYASGQAISSLDSDVSGAGEQLFLRAFTSVPAHWAYTGLTTVGLLLLLPSFANPGGWPKWRSTLTAAGLLAAGPLMHFIWNSPGPGDPGLALLVMVVKMAFNTALFVTVTLFLLRSERRWVTSRIASAPHLLAGFQPEVVASLPRVRTRRRLRRTVRRSGGRRAAGRVGRQQRDALDAIQSVPGVDGLVGVHALAVQP